MSITSIEWDFKYFAVPPVDIIFISSSFNFLATISILFLSVKEISAFFIFNFVILFLEF